MVGITHKDIFTTKRENGHIKKPESTYAVWGIFGLGYRPGRSCVISDHRLKTNDLSKFQHRLGTVVIHELGHNQALDHCATKNCFMSDANEKIQTVDNSGYTTLTVQPATTSYKSPKAQGAKFVVQSL